MNELEKALAAIHEAIVATLKRKSRRRAGSHTAFESIDVQGTILVDDDLATLRECRDKLEGRLAQ